MMGGQARLFGVAELRVSSQSPDWDMGSSGSREWLQKCDGWGKWEVSRGAAWFLFRMARLARAGTTGSI